MPFVTDKDAIGCDHGSRCSLKSVLPKPLQEACDQSDFLSDYLHTIPIGDIGVPTYYPKLSREMGFLERRNLIYPLTAGLFVHIYPNDKGDRDNYIPIEPNLGVNLDEIIPQIET